MSTMYDLPDLLHQRAMCDAKGINVWKSRAPRRCILCWEHYSQYRRECPVCHWLIAPGCYPKKCWSDELNHCRACHDLMELWKHSCCKMQYLQYHYGTCEPDRSQPTVHNCPSNLPGAIQSKIMAYVFPIKNFLWSNFNRQELMKIKQMGSTNLMDAIVATKGSSTSNCPSGLEGKHDDLSGHLGA